MYSQLQIQQYRCMYTAITDSIELVHVQLLQIQWNWCIYTVIQRNNRTGTCIQLLRQNGTGACSYLQIQQTWCMYKLVTDTMLQVHVQSYYRYNRTGACIQLFTDRMELVHVYSYSLLYLQIRQNWCIYRIIFYYIYN